MGIFDIPDGVGVNPDADKRTPLYVTSAIFGFLMTLSVVLRFVSRKVARIPLKADDWLILMALPFAWVCNGVNIYGPLNNGQGRHINHSTPETLKQFFQATWVFLLGYNVAIALAKFSLIFFYRRIFSTTGFKYPLMVVGGFTVAWLIACTFATIFSCTPISGFWDSSKPSKCINERSFYTGQTAANMALDVALLVIPIFAITRLHMSKSNKIAVVGIFALGFFVTVCSAVRLAELIKIQNAVRFDFTYDIVEAAYWSVIEANVSVVCACLPTLRPLLRWVIHGNPESQQYNSRPGYNSRMLDSQGNIISGPFSPIDSSHGNRLSTRPGESATYSAKVYTGERPDSQQEHQVAERVEMFNLPNRSQAKRDDIKVTTDMTWFESKRHSSDTSSTEALKAKDVERAEP